LGAYANVELANITGLVPGEPEVGRDVQAIPETRFDRVHVDDVLGAEPDRALLGLDHHHLFVFTLGQRAVKPLPVGQLNRLPGGTEDFLDIDPVDEYRAHVVRAQGELAALQALDFPGDAIAVLHQNDIGLVGPGGDAARYENQQAGDFRR
jgi:hypothetical protein